MSFILTFLGKCSEKNNDTMDLKEVCRSCLLPSETMMCIFGAVQVPNLDFTQLSILEMLKIFTKISASPNDDLPDNICSDCFDKVQKSYAFKLKFEKSEVFWKQIIEDGKGLEDPSNVYEYYTETDIELIKREKIENSEQLEKNSLPGIPEEEISFVQEVKQEPEIEINMEHTEGSSNIKNFKCLTCSKSFRQKRTLNDHMRIHTGEKPFQCKICLKNFRCTSNLMKHTQTVHGSATRKNTKQKFKCVTCPKLFVRKSSLNRHIRIIHKAEKTFQCNICSEKFLSKFVLAKHLQILHGNVTMMKFKCSLCSRLCISSSALDRHMRMHTGEKQFQCEVCLKKFRFETSLAVHVQSVHGNGTRTKFKCPTCSKLYCSKSHLNRHILSHTEERQFQCEVCKKKFQFNWYLTAHMKTVHADEATNSTKLKCETCSKLFVCKSSLNKHMKIHTDEKLFQCKACPEKFRSNFSLTSHVKRVHTDETTNKTKLKCDKCLKLFVCKSSLNKHMRIHTGEKSFECEVCSTKFLDKNYLKAHVQRMHGVKTEVSRAKKV